ncbi:dNTP triphosphohydrolase [Paenibacillus sp. D2_2]|uniref:dGTP triphosphohydrolase n=1 Tax=Paenibacillus sp. D2_2 TaxID=3073092 RepID=UPI00281525C1|nr:dNTP triphosphohydrolase [Paenibacillus sp. D2_2]WMT42256.1 dNTP triphosphohydrolase [Paenibacillus sp. D2_2]
MAHYDELTIDFVKQWNEKLDGMDFRLNEVDGDDRGRDAYARDYARILYSSSFRRLQGKMQLLGIERYNFIRNRLTHSMEVAQIARGIASDMEVDHTFVVEACALAHDLGNPPIGHHGEMILNELVQDIGIEKKHHAFRGLNLTFRTQLGVIKYFRKYENGKNKKFIYDEDYQEICSVLEEHKIDLPEVATIDMQIMDLADEIAYAAHDLEDCLSQHLFTIDDLLYEFQISEKYREAYDELNAIVNQCRDFAKKGVYFQSSEEYSFLFRKELTSKIVNRLIRDIFYDQEKDRLFYREHNKLAEGLKMLVFSLIMRRPSIQLYEKKGRKYSVGSTRYIRMNT